MNLYLFLNFAILVNIAKMGLATKSLTDIIWAFKIEIKKNFLKKKCITFNRFLNSNSLKILHFSSSPSVL